MAKDVGAQARASLDDERAAVEQFQNESDASVVTNAVGVIREANAAASALLGLPRAALPRKLLIAFVARGDTRRFRDFLRTATRGEGRRTLSLRVRPRGCIPVAATLTVCTVRRGTDGELELHWWLRRTG